MAEVLITLGILGVVIAMTLPSIIGKYQKIVATTQLKKIYNVISNAYLMSVEENGESTGWVYPMAQDGEQNNGNMARIVEFYKMYFAPYLNFRLAETKENSHKDYKIKNFNGNDADFRTVNRTRLESPDGMCMFMWANKQFFVFTVDLNCEKSPNTYGRDVFDVFELSEQKGLAVFRLKQLTNGTYSREDYIEYCKNFTYRSGVPGYCFTLFVYDGMEFKKDYPWR